MRKLNSYENSRAQFARAAKVIPSGIYGHQGPAEGCYIPIEAFPLYSDHAKGSYFWDVDGNRFIDYMCAYGPNVLGYNDPDVDEAARRQAEKENCVTAPSTVMIDFAELLVDTVAEIAAGTAGRTPQAEDQVTLAPMLSRALSPMDFTRPARALHDQVRGLIPWPAAVTELGGVRCKILATTVLDETTGKAPGSVIAADKKGLKLACGGGTVLRIDRLQADGGKRLAAADYLRGHPIPVD